MSNITHAERERRLRQAMDDTPQTLAGLLFVAESITRNNTVTTWVRPDGTVMDRASRHQEMRNILQDMQLRECEDDDLDEAGDERVQ